MNATRSSAVQMLATLPRGPALARSKRPEIQHFANGGQIRHPAEPKAARAPRTGAELILSTLPPSHVGANPMEHGGPIHGPGGPTSDSVPIWASKGEFMLPADTTAAVGKEKLQQLVDATHMPTNNAREKLGRLARADGGFIDDQPGAVTRVGNSYSGGNVTGNITVNGQAPGGTVSTIDAYKVPPPPAPAPVLGAPAAVTPIAPKPVASPMATLPAPVAGAAAPAPAVAPPPAVTPPPSSMQTGGQTSWTGRPQRPSGVDQLLSALAQGQGGQRAQSAPAPAPRAPLSSTNRQIFAGGAQGYADGGEIEDPRKKGLMADPAIQLAAYTPQQAMATISDAAGGSMPAPAAPEMTPLPAGPRPYIAEIPRGRYESAAPDPDPVFTSASPSAPAGSPADATPSVAAPGARELLDRRAPAAAPVAKPAPVQSPTAAQVQLATLPTADVASARPNPLGGLADTNAQLASLQASNAAVQLGGATIIANAATEADRRAQFNEQANLGNTLARTSWSPRRGTQVNDAAVAAAMAPIDARARMAQLTVKEAGDTRRAQIAEHGADARARLADVRQQQALTADQQRLGLESKKVALDASRDDRAAAASQADQARKARVAQLDELILTGAPAQQKAAAAQKAALMGKGLDEAGKTGEVSTAIRKEFESLPEVKNYKQALPSYRGIEDAVKRNTPMSDINIVYGIAKLYDPNSVVREGEYSTVANAPGMPERVKGWAQYVAGGGKLTDEVKKQILTEAKSRMSTFDTEYGAARNRYSDIAKRSSADPSLVVPQDYKPAVAAPAAPTVPPQIAELQRRAASDPAVAARLKQMGY